MWEFRALERISNIAEHFHANWSGRPPCRIAIFAERKNRLHLIERKNVLFATEAALGWKVCQTEQLGVWLRVYQLLIFTWGQIWACVEQSYKIWLRFHVLGNRPFVDHQILLLGVDRSCKRRAGKKSPILANEVEGLYIKPTGHLLPCGYWTLFKFPLTISAIFKLLFWIVFKSQKMLSLRL